MKVLLILLSMLNVNANQIVNQKYQDFFKYTGEEILLYGGAGAGKSYSIADKLLLQPVWQPDVDLKAIVLKKTFPSLRNTALDILEKRAAALNFKFNLNKSEWIARVYNLKIIFLSLNNKEDYGKLQSMTDVDFVWINELPELREADYEEILRRVRGGNSFYSQVMSDFNPENIYSWVNKRFWERNIGNVKKNHYTVYDNHPDFLITDKGESYIAKLKRYKEYDENLYNIFYLGKWGCIEGLIYNWDTVPLPDINFDEIFYGGDFGFTVDPATLVKIYRKGNEYWVQEMIYKTGLTNKYLAIGMKNNVNIDHEDVSYWDCAEPKSIQELYDYGINAKNAIKGQDSVKAGIDYLKSVKIHIVEGSENIIKEQKTYVWAKDKNNESTNKPAKINDHTMDAIRYGIYTHMKAGGHVPHFGSA